MRFNIPMNAVNYACTHLVDWCGHRLYNGRYKLHGVCVYKLLKWPINLEKLHVYLYEQNLQISDVRSLRIAISIVYFGCTKLYHLMFKASSFKVDNNIANLV